jgi:hypothetical protein
MSPRGLVAAFSRFSRAARRQDGQASQARQRRTARPATRAPHLAAESLESRCMLSTTARLENNISMFDRIPVIHPLRPANLPTSFVGQFAWSGFNSFCVEIGQSISPGLHTFPTRAPLASSGLANAGLVADFWRSYGPKTTGFTSVTDAAAFQLGIWELISDGPSRNLKSGSFQVGASASPAVARAESWLNGTGTPAPSAGGPAVSLYVLQHPTRQDQVVWEPRGVDLDVDSNNDGRIAEDDDPIEEKTDLPGVIVPVGGSRAEMIVDVPQGRSATLAITQGADKVRLWTAQTGGTAIPAAGTTIAGGAVQTYWIEAFAPSASMADIAFTLTPKGGSSASADTIRATAVAVDLDVDSDNVGGVQRSAAEDAIEDITDEAGRGIDATPGLYLQVQDEDSDGDGLVNWADGFNGIGDELDIDDVSAGAAFAPLWFQIPAWVYAPDATLEMIYSASDPSAAVMAPHYLSWDRPTDGHLRIWTKDAFLPRNRASIQDGGDYVAPTSRTARSYTLAELGLQPGDNRLFLEAIRESTTTAQQEITFRLTPRFAGKPAAFTLTDTVRATTARIEVLADNRDGTPAFPTFGLTATRMPNPNAGLSGLVPDITQAYTINVYDPRGPQTIHTTYVAGTPLPLVQAGTARYTTPQFLAVPEEDLPLIAADLPVEGLLDGPLHPADVIGQAIVVPVSGSVVQIRYNGETTLGLITKDAAEKAIALLRQVVTQVDARLGDFNPLKGNEGGDQGPGQYLREDPGAMGKEAETRIHNRFADIAKNHPNIKTRQLASQFRKGIIVDAMGIVKEVANKKDDVQLDLVFVRKGYEPKVGLPLDKDSVIVVEVRSSLSGSLTKESLAAREALSARPVAVANFNWRYKQVADEVFEVAEHKRLKGLVMFLEKHGARILKVAPTVFSAGAFAVTNLNSKTYAKSEEIMDKMLEQNLDRDRHDERAIQNFADLLRELIQNHFGDALELPTLLQVQHIMLQGDIGRAVIDQWIEVSKDMEYSTFNR